jgi:hypothetical protein
VFQLIKRTCKALVVAPFVLALVTIAPSARAQFTVNVQATPQVGPGTITAWRDATGSAYSPYPGQIMSTRFTMTYMSGSLPTGLTSPFYAYCVDISNLDQSSATFTSTYVTTSSGANTIDKKTIGSPGLVAGNGMDITDRIQHALWLVDQFGNATGITGIQAGAVQLAVWNVLEDTDFSVTTTGSSSGEGHYFTANAFGTGTGINGIQSIANGYLAQLQAAEAAGGGKGNGFYLHTASGQDVITVGNVVPDGSSAWMLALGILPLSLMIRRGRKLA